MANTLLAIAPPTIMAAGAPMRLASNGYASVPAAKDST